MVRDFPGEGMEVDFYPSEEEYVITYCVELPMHVVIKTQIDL